MSNRARVGRRLHAEPLEPRIALSAQSLITGDELPRSFASQYPWALDQADPLVRAAIANITTTAPTEALFHALDPGEPVDVAADDFTAALVESSALIGLPAFRNDVRLQGIDGHGFSVVMLDTGIDLSNPFFGPDANLDGIADRIVYNADFATGHTNAQDGNGHGTHVSSIIGSQDPTYTGMAPGVNLIHLRVLDDNGSGSGAAIESALQWVVAHVSEYNIASVNFSFTTPTNFATFNTQASFGLNDELAALAAQDVIVASAAGNAFFGFQGQPGVGYPAADPNSLAIGATWDASLPGPFNWASGAIDFTTGPDRIVSFSQRHPTMTTVFAPGAQITAAKIGGGVQTLSGTSMASPHIAGIAALAQQLAVQTTGHRLSLETFRNLLKATGVPILDGDDENDNVANTNAEYRRVDVMALANAILSGGLSDLSVPAGLTVDTPGVAAGGVVRVSFRIANQAPSGTGTFSSGFYLSSDPVIDSSDIFLSAASDAVGGGQSVNHTGYGVPLPANLAPGSYYLGIVLDSGNTVAEGNESNNIAVVPLTVSPPRPEIWLVDAATGTVLNDGAAQINFGSFDQGSADVVKTFRVYNDGSQALTLGPLTLPPGYAASGFPTSVAPQQFAEFTITLSASNAVGVYSGGVSFSTNDTDENPFNLTFTGSVLEPDDHGDNAETATVLTMPAAVNGVILPSGEVDWFRIDAVGGVLHHFGTTLGTLGDSALRLFDTNGTTVLATDDDSGPGLASAITWTAPTSGVYYLEVSRKGTASGSYQLIAAPVDDHGQQADDATPITDPSVNPSAIESPGDADWFAFETLAGVQYKAETLLKTLAGSTISIIDVDGHTPLVNSASEDPKVGSFINWTAPNAGTYFVAVRASQPELIGAYDLKLTGNDDFGDNTANATPLVANSSIGGHIEVPNDVDLFSVSLLAGGRYTFSKTTGTLHDPTIRVFDVDGTTELANNLNDGNSTSLIDFIAPANGEYFVRVNGEGSLTGTYELTVEIIDDYGNVAQAAATKSDPNNTPGVIETSGDHDWFKFEAFAGVSYHLEAALGELPAARIRLLSGPNASTELIDEVGTPGESAAIVWTAPQTATYYLEVSAALADQVGNYRLIMIGDDDHGDNPENASPFVNGSVSGTIERVGDADWFKLSTTPGLIYRVNVNLGTLPGANLEIFEADGVTKVTEASGSNATAQWTASGGAYYVKLTGGASNFEIASVEPTTGTYEINVSLLSTVSGDYDGDGDLDGNDFIVWQRLLGQNAAGATKPLDTQGFENYLSGQLAGQQGWVKTGPAPGSAVVQQAVVQSGAKAVRVSRSGGADVRWGVPLGSSLPSQTLIHVRWDMLITQNSGGSSAVGPFFGVETRDDQGLAGIIGTLGVDATTLEVLYKRQGDSFFSGTGHVAAAGVWQSYAISMDFARHEYTVYFNEQPLVTTGFVDRGDFGNALNQLTSAEIATKATQGSMSSLQANGTAYFDNFRIFDGASGAYMTADGNDDFIVNNADLEIWRQGYGTSFGGVTFNGADVVGPVSSTSIGLSELGGAREETLQSSNLADAVQAARLSVERAAERHSDEGRGANRSTLRPSMYDGLSQGRASVIRDRAIADLGQPFIGAWERVDAAHGADDADRAGVHDSAARNLPADWDAALSELF